MPTTAQPAPSAHDDLSHPPSCADGDALAGGPARDALVRAMQQLTLAGAMTGTCQPAGLCQTLTEVADALCTLHAYGPAESYLARALQWAVVMRSTDTRGDLHCALAEMAANAAELAEARGAAPAEINHWQDRARDHAVEAAGLAGHATDPHWELKLLLRASDVLDRCGDHDDAVHLQQRVQVLMGPIKPDLPTDASALGAGAPATWRSTAPSQLM